MDLPLWTFLINVIIPRVVLSLGTRFPSFTHAMAYASPGLEPERGVVGLPFCWITGAGCEDGLDGLLCAWHWREGTFAGVLVNTYHSFIQLTIHLNSKLLVLREIIEDD